MTHQVLIFIEGNIDLWPRRCTAGRWPSLGFIGKNHHSNGLFTKFSSIFTIWELYPPGFHHLGNISPWLSAPQRQVWSWTASWTWRRKRNRWGSDLLCRFEAGAGDWTRKHRGIWQNVARGGSLAKNTCSSDLKQKTLRLNQPTWFFFSIWVNDFTEFTDLDTYQRSFSFAILPAIIFGVCSHPPCQITPVDSQDCNDIGLPNIFSDTWPARKSKLLWKNDLWVIFMGDFPAAGETERWPNIGGWSCLTFVSFGMCSLTKFAGSDRWFVGCE